MKNETALNALKAENARLKQEVASLRKRNEWLERKVFGSMSDRRTLYDAKDVPQGAAVVQMTLFDDEYLKAYEEAKARSEAAEAEIRRDEQARRKAVRENKGGHRPRRSKGPKWDGLERRERTLVPEGVTEGEYVRIGDDVTETLHKEPAKFWVEVTHRPKYVKASELGSENVTVLQAPAPGSPIGGSHVSSSVLAWLLASKFQWSLPEYRICAMSRQQGVELPTSTVNDWVHACADRLYLLYLRLKERILSLSDYVQADEVPFNINDSKGKIRKGYAWQINDCSGRHLGRFFHYEKGSREKAVPQGLFARFKGAVQVDGYPGYDFLELLPDVTLLGCMAHVRRYFTDAEREDPRATYPLDQIRLLYELERQLAQSGAGADEIQRARLSKGEPILDLLDKWMEMIQTAVEPKSRLGQAIQYAYHMMPRLRRYSRDGRYQIDNNACERGNRTPVIGRKNYLFSANDRYAQDNAVFYSLIETCVDLGVDPLRWLTEVLDKPLLDMTDRELDELLPSRADAQ